ncbi:MAG TPA: hypothetical protein VJS64_03135 [Pyrinomonadaceae bacterium]|nr:hypothetical protein [Pyrinomonadaceae bacterium]
MKKPGIPSDVSCLIALINARTVYWKEIDRRNFFNAHPHADPSEFEERWPIVLTNFLAETVKTAGSLLALSENRQN